MKAWTEKAKASFWSKVDQSAGPDACWPWTRSKTSTGYGQVNMGKSGGPALRAHRVAFQLSHGEIPDGPKNGAQGVAILHSCDNRLCCNPKHLRAGTQLENIQDAYAKGRLKSPQANDAEVKRRAAAYPRLVETVNSLMSSVGPDRLVAEVEATTLLRELGEDA